MSAALQQALEQAIAAAWVQPVPRTDLSNLNPPRAVLVQSACIPIKEWHALVTAASAAGAAP